MANKINIIQLRKEIAAQEAKIIAPRMRDVLNKKFEEEKIVLLNEFDNSPVTKELDKGPSADGTIASTARGGNLYSLLGFVNGVEPARELRNALESGISKGHVIRQISGTKLKYNLEVRTPTLDELKRRTKLLTWTTRSFIDLIENGISNFRRYLFDKSGRLQKYSRSGTAIQTDRDVRKQEFKGVPYITDMLRNFQNRLRNFNKK